MTLASKVDCMTEQPAHSHHSHSMSEMEEICRAKGIKLTEGRRQVLDIILSSDTPLGAYEILNQLSSIKSNAVPMTVYRALDFLMEKGLVHKVESLNAFLACTHPGDSHGFQLLICGECGHVDETCDSTLESAIQNRADSIGFKVGSAAVEITGVCAGCQEGEE